MQVEALTDAPDVDTPLGLRDRAMIGLIYVNGLRVSEIAALKTVEVSLNEGVVRVVGGKDGKDRLVSFGVEAGNWLWHYLHDGRTALLGECAAGALFVTVCGEGITRQTFWYLIKRYALFAGIYTPLSLHALWYTFATYLLNHDVDLRVVQIPLDYADISTAQTYTHVARKRLRTLHVQHYPRGQRPFPLPRMGKSKHVPEMPTILYLKARGATFTGHTYNCVDKDGTTKSSHQLGMDKHHVIKTLVMEDEHAKPLITLIHGDCSVSTKNFAHQTSRKSVQPCKPEVAQRYSGYFVSGTSPFGVRKAMPVYVEASVLELEHIYINGGRRGFLVNLAPSVLTATLNAQSANCVNPD